MEHPTCRDALHRARIECDLLRGVDRDECYVGLNIHEDKTHVKSSHSPTKCVRVGYTQPLFTSVVDGRSREVVYGMPLQGSPTKSV